MEKSSIPSEMKFPTRIICKTFTEDPKKTSLKLVIGLFSADDEIIIGQTAKPCSHNKVLSIT